MTSKASLTKSQIELISSLASQEAIKQFKAQQLKQKKKEQDWRLRNTKLLLENYHRLKDHCEDIDQQIEEYEETVFSLEELTLESLMKYRLKTAKMMRHFERMLKHFEVDSRNGSEEEQRRHKVIYHRYLSDNRFPIQKLCEMYNVEQGTIYRDTKLAIRDLSVLLFGIVALELSH
ncbi:hypothetical protein ACFSO7_20765 [Bacillus sp. CGMCC 1.16607]|uniref:hypothetical protein n=1 Tax=Bacillus sp. CGMCC 1.16607 TaxID=3351842 RepID=UPI00363595AF